MGEEVDRRTWLKVAGGTVAGLAIGAAVGYLGKPTPPPAGVVTETVRETVTQAAETVTTTVTETVGVGTPVPLPPVVGETVAERAINGAKELVNRGVVPKDATLTIFCASPLEGSHMDTQAAWEDATGIKLAVSTVPVGEVYEKLMLEAVAKTGAYDVFQIKPYWFGDMEGGGLITDITEWVRRYDPRAHGEPDGVAYNQDVQQSLWKGRYYGLSTDNDAHYAYYRRDLLEDPKEQENFEKQYGYPLKMPESWKEYRDCAEFFYRPPDLYGCVEQRCEIYNALPVFICRLASKKWPHQYLFDEDMNPTLTSEESIEAATEHNEMIQWMPEGITAWTIGEVYGFYAKGKAFEAINYPSFMKSQQDPATSVIVGNCVAQTPPGSWVTKPDGTEVLNRKTTGALGWTISVSNYSKYPELAYLYSQFYVDPENLVIESTGTGSWVDPCRYNQFVDPRQIKTHTESMMGVAAATARVGMPFFCIRGAEEYIMALVRGLVDMYVGTMTPEQTMESVAEKWDEITDKLGREEQKQDWKFVMDNYYPK